jgi:TatD DNase family protein
MPVLFDAHIHLSELTAEEQKRPLPVAILSSVHDPADPTLALNDPGILCSYGLHPLWLDGAGRSRESLEMLASIGKIAAVGECGFDFYNGRSPEEEAKQREFFLAQCSIAERYRLPVVIHVRRGMAEIFAETATLKRLSAIIFHCYPGTAEEGSAFLKRGVNAFFSFGTPIIKNFAGAQQALKELPGERILFETDAPFQPPRGRERTVVGDIVAIYDKASEILHIERAELERRTWTTACTIFPQLKKISR